MISILIPTYNYNVVPLVSELHDQCLKCAIEFEILVYDDGSKSQINSFNNTINNIQNCTFKELPNNIGRSSIRNLLAKDAKYNLLLFIDSGTFPKEKNFIEKYIAIKNEKVICGGMTYLKKIPKKPYKLRWVYTKKRERKTLCSSNFLIKKKIFKGYPFDESIKSYGYEDVLFFNTLKRNQIQICFFKNQVVHNSDDDANTFLKKTEYAIENLSHLVEQGKLTKEDSKVFKYSFYIEKLNLVRLATLVFKILKKPIVLNLNSNYPFLLLYDMYRIGYLCQLKTKK
ncbi:glycosyltransferase family 2 protein [Confluentibacter flavum]|uniref:Glycosyl transferase n=1 Tax=Confluentibacter flavum TaxID=1909700 RepID=A0A2N3HEZ1_9FLAO|nr:glycosyltransferase family A protein [Confluentibacter flavum]PKQ43550.1 glycosyl transferase [Confluentibacter flavum]